LPTLWLTIALFENKKRADLPESVNPPLYAKERIKNSEGKRIQDSGDRTLREEPRRRTIVVAAVVNPARVKLDPAVAEQEVRRVAEIGSAIRTVFIAGTVDPEIVIVPEPFGMCQNHDSDRECSETEFVSGKDLAGSSNRLAAVAYTELAETIRMSGVP